MPFVWNDRLLLFWLRVIKQPPPHSSAAHDHKGSSTTKTPTRSSAKKSQTGSSSDDSAYKHTPLSPIKQGAANFSFLNDAEPVRRCDAISWRVSPSWPSNASRRFVALWCT